MIDRGEGRGGEEGDCPSVDDRERGEREECE
jgi:hypothetical protein